MWTLANASSETLIPAAYEWVSRSQRTLSPAVLVVAAINCTIT
jgi:hypothetical protein